MSFFNKIDDVSIINSSVIRVKWRQY